MSNYPVVDMHERFTRQIVDLEVETARLREENKLLTNKLYSTIFVESSAETKATKYHNALELLSIVRDFLNSSDNDGYWATNISELRARAFKVLEKESDK